MKAYIIFQSHYNHFRDPSGQYAVLVRFVVHILVGPYHSPRLVVQTHLLGKQKYDLRFTSYVRTLVSIAQNTLTSRTIYFVKCNVIKIEILVEQIDWIILCNHVTTLFCACCRCV